MYTNHKNSVLKSLCLAVVAALLTSSANAADVLMVDTTSAPNTITITALDGLASAGGSFSTFTGIYLESFFNAATGTFNEFTTGSTFSTANEMSADPEPGIFRAGGVGTPDPGLNFYDLSTQETISVTAGTVPFVGTASWTIDPQDFVDFATASSSGNVWIDADDSGDLATAINIGTYKVSVVPEAHSLGLLGLGLGLVTLRLVMLRKRK